MTGHEPVLLEQVLDLLNPRAGQVYVDCTVGRGGHAEAVGLRLGSTGRVIGLDVDQANLDYAGQRLSALPGRVDLVRANFAQVQQVLADLGVVGHVDAEHAGGAGSVDLLVADLGFASTQMDDPDRGFSFMSDGPLDMRLDDRLPVTAADLVNDLPEQELANLIYELGEERLSRKIARKIVENRQREPIHTTLALATIVQQAYGPLASRRRPAGKAKGGKAKAGRSRRGIHPATRTFMALRIAVNQELAALDRLLEALPGVLRPGGVAAIISFHSLEDRRVKRAMLAMQQAGLVKRLTTRPLTASESEIERNPRSRSAKLRALRRLDVKGYTG